VTVLPFFLAVWIFMVGLYGIVTSRNLIHIAVCVSVCQSATYVLLLGIGYRKHGTAPVFGDIPTSRTVVDPVVQSLTLTDIVVSVTVLALILALALDVHKEIETMDPDQIVELQG
jgi:multicomponent Na+:H+ antiporter subunit C